MYDMFDDYDDYPVSAAEYYQELNAPLQWEHDDLMRQEQLEARDEYLEEEALSLQVWGAIVSVYCRLTSEPDFTFMVVLGKDEADAENEAMLRAKEVFPEWSGDNEYYDVHRVQVGRLPFYPRDFPLDWIKQPFHDFVTTYVERALEKLTREGNLPLVHQEKDDIPF